MERLHYLTYIRNGQNCFLLILILKEKLVTHTSSSKWPYAYDNYLTLTQLCYTTHHRVPTIAREPMELPQCLNISRSPSLRNPSERPARNDDASVQSIFLTNMIRLIKLSSISPAYIFLGTLSTPARKANNRNHKEQPL